MKVKVLITQSYSTLSALMDCSLSGTSVHEIIQTRMLEWVAIPFPGDLSNPGIEPGLLYCRQVIYCLKKASQYFISY